MFKFITWIALSGTALATQGLREEELASQAAHLWKEWAHVWDGSVTDQEMAPHLAGSCHIALDTAEKNKTTLSQISISQRLTAPKIQGRAEVLKSFRQWPETWANGKIIRSKFKVVGIKVNESTVTTTQLVTVLAGKNPVTEYNGTWKSDWLIQGDDLIFQSSIAVSGQVVTLDQETIFQDVTASILPPGSDTDLELTGENFFWRERIPAAFEPDQFGETGVSIADLNGDGLEDVYLCQIGGLRNRLWLRSPDGLLKESPPCGLEIRDNTCSALFLDFDGDRDRDAVLTTAVGVVFFENDGTGLFTEKKRLPKINKGFGMSAADYDQDGDLDLYICQYHGSDEDPDQKSRGAFPHPYPVYDAKNGGSNLLLRNDGHWTFHDATEDSGLNQDNQRLTYASLWEDFDNDGDQDLFIVNDFGPNNYFQNQGNGRFLNRSAIPGVRDGGFGMGMTTADFDHDGRYDIHISNMYSGAGNRIARQDWFHSDQDPQVRKTLLSLARGNTLLKNIGSETFQDNSTPSGISMGRWSWASLAVDLNNDSREDLLVANGFVTGKDPDDL